MPLTLYEASKINSGDVVRAGIIEMFARESDVLRAMVWEDVPGGAYRYNQEGTLPGVGFRGINQAFSESVGIINPQVEALRIAGGDLDVDKALIEFHGDSVRTTQEMMKVKAMSLYVAAKVIKGNSLSDPLEFDGLQNRIAGSQLIAAGSTNGGDPLSLAKLDEAIDAVDNPTHLIMSKALRRRLTQAARDTAVGGFISYDVDEFGRKVTKYNDLPILIADYDNNGARILDFNEVGPGGATATCQSIYVVQMGSTGVLGLQNKVMDVRDLGEIDAAPVVRTRIDWNVSFACLHGRCAARVWGISDAAFVD
jgi:hypothetical protein